MSALTKISTLASVDQVAVKVQPLGMSELSHPQFCPETRSESGAIANPAWWRAWYETHVPLGNWQPPPYIYAVLNGDSCLATAGFARQRMGPVSIVSLGGYYWPFRGLCSSADGAGQLVAARALADTLVESRPSVGLRFGPISGGDSGTCMLLEELFRRGWRGLQKNTGGVFELPLNRNAESSLAQASPSMLKNLLYLRRRLEREQGEVQAVRHFLDADDEALLRKLEAIEVESWVHKSGGETKFVGERNRAFWRAIACNPRTDVRVAFWILYAGGRPLSFSANLETSSTVYVIANSFDETWNRFSPGSLLTFDVIADASSRGFTSLSWGQGDSGYKHRWGAQSSSALHDVLLFRSGMLGSCMEAIARKRLSDWSTFDPAVLNSNPGAAAVNSVGATPTV